MRRPSRMQRFRLQTEYGYAVILPDTCPFNHEPGSKLLGTASRHFHLQRCRRDPALADDLMGIDSDLVRAARNEYRAQLVLGTCRAKLRLVLELKQKM